jgi:hypothetical protein
MTLAEALEAAGLSAMAARADHYQLEPMQLHEELYLAMQLGNRAAGDLLDRVLNGDFG